MPRSSRLIALTICAALAVQPALAETSRWSGVTGALIERIGLPKPQASIAPAPVTPSVIPPEEPIDPNVAQSVGCVAVGLTGTSIAMLAGGENVVNILSGGLVVPVNQIALYTAIIGVVFGTFCAVGQAVTPLYLYAMRAAPNGNGAKTMADSSCRLPKISNEPRRVEELLIRASLVTQVDAEIEARPEDVDMSAPREFRRRR